MSDEAQLEGLRRQVSELEDQIRFLSAAAALRYADASRVVSEDAVALARAGKTIDAVRLIRKETGAGLIPSKRIVDEIRRNGPT